MFNGGSNIFNGQWLMHFPESIWSPGRAAIPMGDNPGTGGPSKKFQHGPMRRLALPAATPGRAAIPMGDNPGTGGPSKKFQHGPMRRLALPAATPSTTTKRRRQPQAAAASPTTAKMCFTELEPSSPVVGALLPLASNLSISPLPAAGEPQVPIKWGSALEGFASLHLPGMRPVGAVVDLSDMRALLNAEGSTGWVTNFSIDAFFSTLMPGFHATETLQPARVFLPAWVSKHVQETGGEFPPSNETANRVAALRTAREIYVVYNLGPNLHWAVMRLQRQRKRLEIFDSLLLVESSHGRQMLDAISVYLHENMDDWLVVVYSDVPQQTDTSSCGVFMCVIAKHLLEDATLPSISNAIPAWRAWIARALVQGAVR